MRCVKKRFCKKKNTFTSCIPIRDQVPGAFLHSTLLTHTILCTHILNLNQHNPHPRVILLVSIWSKHWILRIHLKSHLIPFLFLPAPLSHCFAHVTNWSKDPRLKFHVPLVPPSDCETSTHLHRLVKWNQTAGSTRGRSSHRSRGSSFFQSWELFRGYSSNAWSSGIPFLVTSGILDELRWIYLLTNMENKGVCFSGLSIYLHENHHPSTQS